MLRITRRKPNANFYTLVEEPKKVLFNWARRPSTQREQLRAPIDHDMFRYGYLVDVVAKAFDGRCAYCEREIGTSEGIGHFRPLNLTTRYAAGTVDHYSWLAYEWRNLVLLCKRCESAREDKFPVEGRHSPFLATLDEIEAIERPLLIDPTRENPLHHLSYLVTGECFPDWNSRKGKVTADIFRLNEEFLIQERRTAIEHTISVWRKIIEAGSGLPDDFLKGGSYLGACRNVVSRAIAEFGISGVQVRPTSSFHRALRTLLALIRPSERDRMLAAIDSLEISDRKKRYELEDRRSHISPTNSALPASLPLTPKPAFRSEIKDFRISNLRAVDELEIRFPQVRSKKAGAPCLLFLGENSVGKSTCLLALALALVGTKEAKRLNLPYRDFGRSSAQDGWDLWGGQAVRVDVTFHDRAETAAFRYNPTREEFGGTEDPATIVLGYGPHRYIADVATERRTRPADRVRSLFDPLASIPDPSPWLIELAETDSEKFDQVVRAIRGILPVGDDDRLANDAARGIGVFAHNQFTPISQLSEGYRSMFAMITDVCRSLLDHYSNLETARGVVLIDEIETHLHPRWKMRVMTALRQAFPRVQFVVTTHDPLCLRGMDDNEVIVLTRDDAGRVQLVEDLPPIGGMKIEQILTSEYFGLSSTVDPETELEIVRVADKIADGSSASIGLRAAELVSKITVGDTATEQIIHEALRKFLIDRERPKDGLTSTARPAAVEAVVRALRAAKANKTAID
ncbi:AAA family ATPase [Neorhizobium sp. DAR64872/K0K18]|uniref:AAA family ATPase n=1 Tax=Neorhizobium sp. DAR64872/K0K18 TaxID=3421958 RepID=UPI003D2770CC